MAKSAAVIKQTHRACISLLMSSVLIAACGGGAGDPVGLETELTTQPVGNAILQDDQVPAGEPVQTDNDLFLEQSQSPEDFIPEFPLSNLAIPAATESEIMANSGLQISSNRPLDDGSSDAPDFTERQWVHMQNCLGITAVAPEVEIVSGRISAESQEDDAVRYIDGSIVATAHVSDTGAVIQISEGDFDGSLGTPGSFLRSIMGRYLWFSAELAERDYPFECARIEP